jgi:hypothetical protein
MEEKSKIWTDKRKALVNQICDIVGLYSNGYTISEGELVCCSVVVKIRGFFCHQ